MINIILQNLLHMKAVALEYRHHFRVFRQDIGFKRVDFVFSGNGCQPFDKFGADAFFLIRIQHDKGDFRGFRNCR